MMNRMGVAVVALVGLLVSAYMSAYKFGLLGTILCGTGGCETVQNSPWAVQFGIPVPLLGLVGYGALFVLALLGLQPRFQDERWVAGLILGGASVGFFYSLYLTYLEAAVIHAWCRWCIASAIIATLLFLLALPEIRRLRSANAAA